MACKKCGDQLPSDLSATYLKRQLCRDCYNQYRTPNMEEDHVCRVCAEPLNAANIYAGQGYVCRACFILSTAESRKKRKRDAAETEQEEAPYEVAETFIPERKDHLYAMQQSRFGVGEIKVGKSHDPIQRAKELGKSQNFRMEILKIWHYQGHLEATVHRRLKARKVTSGDGQEWFQLDVQTLDFIVQGVIAESQLL